MQDFVVGFIDPNEPDEIKPPAPKSKTMTTMKSSTPDRIPDEVKARVKVIRRYHKRSLTYIEKYGLKDKKTVKLQAATRRPAHGNQTGAEIVRPAGP